MTFWTKLAQKRYFWTKTKKVNSIIQFYIFKLGIKFHLKLTILTIWNKFSQKGYFQSKAEKVNIAIEFCIFELKTDNFDFLDQICPKRAFLITTAQLHSWKPEFRFCIGSNPAYSVLEIRDGEDLWQWSWLEIRLCLLLVNHTTKQFIIIIINEKSEHCHRIVHMWISVGTKF